MRKSLSKIDSNEVRILLDTKYEQYNTARFIGDDPIAVPHAFNKLQDIEIAALFSSTIAWGNRKSIVKNAFKLMQVMDNAPYTFVMHANKKELKTMDSFVHRTFNGTDVLAFIKALRNTYKTHKSLEELFLHNGDAFHKINGFRTEFVKEFEHARSLKHVSNPETGSAAKRLNMFLRWMVRHDSRGVDFGLWKKIKPAELMLPLDVHTGNTARKLGLLTRKQDDRKAVEEVTANLRQFCTNDPVKYDFALFGLGVYEKF